MTATAAELPPRALAAIAAAERPIDIDRFGASFGVGLARGAGVLTFRFCFREVPFTASLERRAERPVLRLAGELGHLPYTIENPARRRRLRTALAAARQGSGLDWEITERNVIRASGEIEIGRPLTPPAIVAGATTLLLRSQPYLELIVTLASE
jgi:hypothetical protein